jgi:hypothetical protein
MFAGMKLFLCFAFLILVLKVYFDGDFCPSQPNAALEQRSVPSTPRVQMNMESAFKEDGLYTLDVIYAAYIIWFLTFIL